MMLGKLSSVVALALAFVGVVGCALADLASGGGAIQSGPTEPEKFAAEELTRWIGEISEQPVGESFCLGTEYLSLFPEDRAALAGTDGFAVRRKDGAIYIVSPKPRGVLYGVYAFLERNSDLIWPRADAETEAVFTRVRKLEVKEADFRERPCFDIRGWWLCGPAFHAPSELWFTRQRCDFTPAALGKPGVEQRVRKFGTVINRGGGHNMPRFYTDELFTEHPEYFGEENGSRVRSVDRVHPCFTNLDGARAAGRVAVAAMARLPEQPPERYAIKLSDHQWVCKCEKCRNSSDTVSTQFFKYLNVMMSEIRKAYPETIVTTFAYQLTAEPPAVKVDDHVLVSYCPYVKDDKRSILDPENAVWKNRADRWVKEGGARLNWREYFGDGMAFPRPIANAVARDLRYVNDELGVRSVFGETLPDQVIAERPTYAQGWDVSAMEFWVLSRLMWDPHQSVEKLRGDYLVRTYRSAAPAVGRFYKPIIDAFYKSPAPSYYSANQYAEAMRYLIKTGLEDGCRAALDEAARLAADEPPVVGRLVQRLRARFDDWCVHKHDFERQELSVPKTTDWAKAATCDMFRRRGAPGVKSSERTVVRVRHDAETLFVSFRCDDRNVKGLTAPAYDPSREITIDGDGVQVFFALGREKTSPWICVSCDVNGNRADIKSVSPWGKFKADWKATCIRDEKGYSVDFELPFRSFGLDPERNKNLDVCFYRLVRHRRKISHQSVETWGGADPRDLATWGILKLE